LQDAARIFFARLLNFRALAFFVFERTSSCVLVLWQAARVSAFVAALLVAWLPAAALLLTGAEMSVVRPLLGPLPAGFIVLRWVI
jgi:hypothetical protein